MIQLVFLLQSWHEALCSSIVSLLSYCYVTTCIISDIKENSNIGKRWTRLVYSSTKEQFFCWKLFCLIKKSLVTVDHGAVIEICQCFREAAKTYFANLCAFCWPISIHYFKAADIWKTLVDVLYQTIVLNNTST